MNTVAIIPARGGSKGIKNKNIIDLLGKPLIYYVLDICYNTPEIDHVAVTTDSDLIASIVLQEYPNTIIIKRPENLSDDNATSEVALLHAIKVLSHEFSNINKIVFVQATSPLTTNSDLSKLIGLLDEYDSAAFYIDDYGFFFEQDNMTEPRMPRQKREPRKREAGNAWAFKKDGFIKNKTRLYGDVGLCKISSPCDLEIDEPVDLKLIEMILGSNQ